MWFAQRSPYSEGNLMKPSALSEALHALISQRVPLHIWDACGVRQSLIRGTADLWKRLQDVVSHMVDRLNEPESRFHSSLVTPQHS
jgi:hypothetical protein